MSNPEHAGGQQKSPSSNHATIQTRTVRAGIESDLHHGAVVPPLHLSTTFAFEGFGRKREHDYSRTSNPTRALLATAIADLEEGADAVITSSGMAAVALVLHLVRPGDVVLAAHDCYGGTHRLLRAFAARGLFQLEYTDLSAATAPAEILRRCPRLVWVETPSNPLLRITDIRMVAAAGHAAGALVVVDNTFLSPALQRPIALGADVVVHSTTKYINGHSDVVGGAVIARDAALGEELAWWANALGVTGAPFDSYLTLRGVRTLFARIAVHEANAAEVVATLRCHPAIGRVYHPGIPSHPGHAIACAQQSGFGSMVSFELLGGAGAVETLTASLEHFSLAESLGGVESLIAHPATMTHASMDAAARAHAGIDDALVRISVGIERAEDLVRDLRRGLDLVARSSPDACSVASAAPDEPLAEPNDHGEAVAVR